MQRSIPTKCVCGALILTVSIGGMVVFHDPHTHTERTSEPSQPGAIALVSSTATQGVPVFSLATFKIT